MQKIKILLGSYIDGSVAQDVNCYHIAKYLDKAKFEVHALTHGGKIDLPDVICHKISENAILKNIEKALVMLSVKADVYYLPRVERADVWFAKMTSRVTVSSVEIQTIYDSEKMRRFFTRDISGYFCISDFLNRLNIEKWGESAPVLYLGTDSVPGAFIHKEVARIAYVAGFFPRKRPELFLEVAKMFPDVDFVMIGDGPLLDKIKTAASALPAHNVSFTGRLSNPDAISQLKSSDLLLVTSRQEGLPKVILEAASQGVPSIYINKHYQVDYIENGVNGYAVSGKTEMADVIRRLRSDSGEYRRVSEGAIKTAKEYQWGRLISGYEEFFENYAGQSVRS